MTPETLPPGWRKMRGPRPKYKRDDGCIVRLDNPDDWSITWPGEKQPAKRGFPHRSHAMEWLDTHHPLEEVEDGC